MAAATVRAPQPGNRKARHVRQDERTHTNFFSSNDETSTTDTYRLQFLIDRYGVSHERSLFISALVWGGAHV